MSKKRLIKATSLIDRLVQKYFLNKGDYIMNGDVTITMGNGEPAQITAVINGITKDISVDNFVNDILTIENKKDDFYATSMVFPSYFRKPNFVAKEIIPEVTDVEVINNCVTILTFADGTKEKAVLDKQDTFNLEQGISICLTKKLLSQLTLGNGNKTYNKLIKNTLKKYFAKLDAIEKQKKADEQKKKKYAKIAAKKAKRKEKQKEARINEQAEAYRRALQSISTSNSAE